MITGLGCLLAGLADKAGAGGVDVDVTVGLVTDSTGSPQVTVVPPLHLTPLLLLLSSVVLLDRRPDLPQSGQQQHYDDDQAGVDGGEEDYDYDLPRDGESLCLRVWRVGGVKVRAEFYSWCVTGTIICGPVVAPLLAVPPRLHNYEITRSQSPSPPSCYLTVLALALTAPLPPLVGRAGLTPLPVLLVAVTLALAVLRHGDGGAGLVTQSRAQPAPGQHHGDCLGPAQAGHAHSQAGG